jgi:hypothetical protein
MSIPGGPPLIPDPFGRLDDLRYGDLLHDFGTPGLGGGISDEEMGKLTGATRKENRAAGHDFRNDAGVRPMKPYSNQR